MKDCPLVIVRWEDSAQPIPRWQHLSELDPPDIVECATVGWLIRDDDKVKVVAQSIGGIMRWPRLFGQFFRFDEWSLCRG